MVLGSRYHKTSLLDFLPVNFPLNSHTPHTIGCRQAPHRLICFWLEGKAQPLCRGRTTCELESCNTVADRWCSCHLHSSSIHVVAPPSLNQNFELLCVITKLDSNGCEIVLQICHFWFAQHNSKIVYICKLHGRYVLTKNDSVYLLVLNVLWNQTLASVGKEYITHACIIEREIERNT